MYAIILLVSLSISARLAPPPPADAPRVPLRPGLTIVTALNEPLHGDYESIKVIVRADDQMVQLRYTTEAPAPKEEDNPFAALLGGGKSKPKASANAQPGEKPEMQKVNVTRTVRRDDLKSAHEYQWLFGNGAPEVYPHSTAIGVSSTMLTELKSGAATPLKTPAGGMMGALGSMIGGLLGQAGGARSKELDDISMLSGTLTRVEAGTVPFKVLLNDEPVELPAVHARGQLGDERAEFWILDDAENPLCLRWSVGESRLQVIKLSYPVEVTNASSPGGGPAKAGAGAGPASGEATAAASTTAARLERDLEKQGRAIVYGIYFDFASDRLKVESEPVLTEIAKVLQENPTWSLALEGHTDNIGGDAYNLDLSKRRSAAVKQALVARHKIEAKRLQTSGYGASRPKDTNETMEGRARNRRVELVKAG